MTKPVGMWQVHKQTIKDLIKILIPSAILLSIFPLTWIAHHYLTANQFFGGLAVVCLLGMYAILYRVNRKKM